jgi:hypothetical protein
MASRRRADNRSQRCRTRAADRRLRFFRSDGIGWLCGITGGRASWCTKRKLSQDGLRGQLSWSDGRYRPPWELAAGSAAVLRTRLVDYVKRHYPGPDNRPPAICADG